MSNLTKKTLDQKIIDVQVALNQMKQEDFPVQLSEYGYNDETIAMGQKLYDEATALIEAKNRADCNMNQVFKQMDEALAIAKKYYNEQVTFARIAFTKEPFYFKELHIDGRRERKFVSWLTHAKAFYVAAKKPQILAQLERFGITLAKLQQGQQLIEQLSHLHAKKADKKGLAQVATDNRNKKCAELFAWYWDFKRIARIVLGKDSQHLERLGITVYSPGYKPK